MKRQDLSWGPALVTEAHLQWLSCLLGLGLLLGMQQSPSDLLLGMQQNPSDLLPGMQQNPSDLLLGMQQSPSDLLLVMQQNHLDWRTQFEPIWREFDWGALCCLIPGMQT